MRREVLRALVPLVGCPSRRQSTASTPGDEWLRGPGLHLNMRRIGHHDLAAHIKLGDRTQPVAFAAEGTHATEHGSRRRNRIGGSIPRPPFRRGCGHIRDLGRQITRAVTKRHSGCSTPELPLSLRDRWRLPLCVPVEHIQPARFQSFLTSCTGSKRCGLSGAAERGRIRNSKAKRKIGRGRYVAKCLARWTSDP